LRRKGGLRERHLEEEDKIRRKVYREEGGKRK
jgi:hypothetical protein